MADILKNLFKDKKSQSIQDEIRSKVLARYAELQGIEKESSEMEATLEALHSITGLPRHEIEQIAREVQESHTELPQQESPVLPETGANTSRDHLALQQLNHELEGNKQAFVYHLIPYLLVNTSLIILNVITSSFPWSMFPLFFWGIGLVSHYLSGVYWPGKELKRKVEMTQSQLHQILSEYSQDYAAGKRPGLYQGLLRLTLAESPQEQIETYLQQADDSLSATQLKQMSIQLMAVQRQFLPRQVDNNRMRGSRNSSPFTHQHKQHRRPRR